MNGKNFSGRVITENLMRKSRLVLRYDDPYLIYLFVNILTRPHSFENLDDDLTIIWLVFNFFYRILTQLKKFFRWSYFFPKTFSFLHQFQQFTDEYLCGLSCSRTSRFHPGKKILISTTVKFPLRKIIPDRQNISN